MEEEETVGGFMGVLAVAIGGVCSHLVKTGGAGGGGKGGGAVAVTVFVELTWWQPSRLKVMCQVSARCFRHSRWSFCAPLFFQLIVCFCCIHFTVCTSLFYSSCVHTVSLFKISLFAGIHANIRAFVHLCTVCVCVCVCRTRVEGHSG